MVLLSQPTEVNMLETQVCEVCGNSRLVNALNLGNHPMCDDLKLIGDLSDCQEFPIEILYCENCKTAHQRFQVPKKSLFPDGYHYRSRFTADVLNGMKSLVDNCTKRFKLGIGKKILDVGCNDGSLLNFFRDQGCSTYGIEPTLAAQDAKIAGHDVYKDYLTCELSEKFVEKNGCVDLITFTNVFAHIEDLTSVLKSLKILSNDDTVIVIENHYLGSVLSRNQFDTFYHEHPRTYSFSSFITIAKTLNKEILGVDFPSRYGGNIRVIIGNSEKWEANLLSSDLQKILLTEDKFGLNLKEMELNINRWKFNKGKLLTGLVEKYGPLPAKAFPGRSAILIKLLDIDVDQIEAVYEKPGSLKIGHYVPGTKIPIKSDVDFFKGMNQGPVINFAWHIANEIQDYMYENGFIGEIINILDEDDFTL